MNPTIVLVRGAFAESRHALTASQPRATADVILEAAALPAAA